MDIRIREDAARAARETRAGLRRLFMLALAREAKYLHRNLPGIDRLCLAYSKIDTCEALRRDIVASVFEQLFVAPGPVRDAAAFERRLGEGKGRVVERGNELCRLLGEILPLYQGLAKQLGGALPPAWLPAVADMKAQLAGLIHPGFVLTTAHDDLRHFPRYLKAMQRRLEKLPGGEARDRQAMMTVAPFWQDYQRRREHCADPAVARELERFRWMIEELRVSLFAQELKTRYPVSAKRLEKFLAALEAAH